MRARTYVLLMALIVILHYLVPYYITKGFMDGVYWILEASLALLLTFYYITRGETWRRN